MRNAIACAALAGCALPGACLPAAAAETWHFAYRGFHDAAAGVFLPDRMLTGSFTGWDDDGDGIVARHEITAFMLNDFDYIACEAQSNEYWRCGTERFSYALGGALSFTAGERGTDPEGWYGGGHYFTAGDGEYEYQFRPGSYEERAYLWTDRTTFAISAAPEPATWAALLAGLPLALRAAWRKHRPRTG